MTDRHIRLTWGQAVTLLGFILALTAAWYDMRNQLSASRADIMGLRVEMSVRLQVVERRLDRLEHP